MKANLRTTCIALLVVVAAAAVWTLGRPLPTADRGQPGQARWEYAQLHLSDGKAVFAEAGKELTVTPPVNRLSGNKLRGDPSGEKYTVDSRIARNHDIGALNHFGAQGWEAVSVTPKGTGYLILMKRPF